MTKPAGRKHIHDVAPGVEEELDFREGTSRLPTPEDEHAADDLSPDQKTATQRVAPVKSD
jgi:hypothetical protein